jgi:hypothetical protein
LRHEDIWQEEKGSKAQRPETHPADAPGLMETGKEVSSA